MRVLVAGCLSLLEDLMKFGAFMAFSFVTFTFFWFHFVSLYIWLYVLYAFV